MASELTRDEARELRNLTSDILRDYVSNNSVPYSELGGLVGEVFTALAGGYRREESEPETLQWPAVERRGEPRFKAEPEPAALPPPAPPAPLVPIVPIGESLTPSRLICLECGRHMKVLKSHLKKYHQLTPDAYRAKWGLWKDYPMTAPEYSAERAKMAKDTGLGKKMLDAKRAKAAAEPAPLPSEAFAPKTPTNTKETRGGLSRREQIAGRKEAVTG